MVPQPRFIAIMGPDAGGGVADATALDATRARVTAAREARRRARDAACLGRGPVATGMVGPHRAVVAESGRPELARADGRPLGREEARAALLAHADAVSRWLAAEAEAIEAEFAAIADTHIGTPVPSLAPPSALPFSEPEPLPPSAAAFAEPMPDDKAALAAWTARFRAHERAVSEAVQGFPAKLGGWRARRDAHEAAEAARVATWMASQEGGDGGMARRIAGAAAAMGWPADAVAGFSVEGGRTAWVCFDLPGEDDLPYRGARAESGRLVVSALPRSRLREGLARHAHGAVLRLAGLAFASLPGIRKAVVTAMGTRAGRPVPVLSARLHREPFHGLVADGVADPIAALDRFECRRAMRGDFNMRPVEAIVPPSAAGR